MDRSSHVTKRRWARPDDSCQICHPRQAKRIYEAIDRVVKRKGGKKRERNRERMSGFLDETPQRRPDEISRLGWRE